MKDIKEILTELMHEQNYINDDLRSSIDSHHDFKMSPRYSRYLLINNLLIKIFVGYADERDIYYYLKQVKSLEESDFIKNKKKQYDYLIEVAYKIDLDFGLQLHLIEIVEKIDVEIFGDDYRKYIINCEKIREDLRDKLLGKEIIRKLS
jgi:phage anti-repressor protein